MFFIVLVTVTLHWRRPTLRVPDWCTHGPIKEHTTPTGGPRTEMTVSVDRDNALNNDPLSVYVSVRGAFSVCSGGVCFTGFSDSLKQ